MAGKNKGKLLKIGPQQETKKKNMLRLLKLEIITKITGSFLQNFGFYRFIKSVQTFQPTL